MTPQPLVRRRAAVCTLASVLALGGCATTPKPSRPAVAAPAAPPPLAPIIHMAPIPNPVTPREERSERLERSERPERSVRSPHEEPAGPAEKPEAAAAKPPQPDRARAARLRAAGLEQLDRGAIDRAVALLQQASQLDPGNKLIRRDLDRAVRISRAVRARH